MTIRTFDEMDRMFDQMRSAFGRPDRWSGYERPDYRTGHGTGHGTGHDHADRSTGGLGGVGRTGDLVERDGEYAFVMDAPGFDLEFEAGTLTVTAEQERGDDAITHSRTLRKQVSVPGEVLEDEISATFRNGVLEVILPVAESDEEYEIEVR